MNSDTILSTKRAVLSTNGTSFNQLYYNTINSSVSLLECTFQYNQVISLPSLNFGSTSQINIPNDQFFDVMILHLVLPNVQQSETLARGWGAAILSNIAWTYGSSNSTQIMLQGDSIFQTIMSQTTDPLKRLELFQLMGQEQLAPAVPVLGADTPVNEAFVVVPLPNSTVCDKLPIDTTMLQNNITIQIQFNSDPTCIYGGTASHPISFLKAEVILRQGKLSDQSKSARSAMIAVPTLEYNYPFIHTQNFVTPSFPGVRASDGAGVLLNLNTFLNADIVAIVMYVVADTDKKPVNGNTPNPYNMDPISNVLLQFAGQTIFQYPGQAYKLTNMLAGGDQSASYIPGSYVLPGNTNPFQSVPVNQYMVYFDFSMWRSTCFHSHFDNTWRLTNQTLNLQFNTLYGSNVSYRCYCSFFYNALITFKNGTSSVYID